MPFAVFGALASVRPDKVIADCGSPLWNVYFAGKHQDQRNFVKMFFMNGGPGARQGQHGAACLSFLSNVVSVSSEGLQSSVHLLIREKALIPNSGGAGRWRGGAGQRISFEVTGEHPVAMTIRHERVKFPARGMLGGGAGAPGRDLINGKPIPAKGRYVLEPGDVATFETPGGGGFEPPASKTAGEAR